MADRFSFGDAADEPVAGDGGSNRLFIIIALGLVGLLMLGLLGIGGWALIIRPRQRARVATMEPTVAVVAAAETPTEAPTSTPTATVAPTNTPAQEATNTPVVPTATATEMGAATATSVYTLTPTPGGEGTTPDTGLGGATAAMGAVLLLGLLFAARRLRLAN